MQNTYTYTKFFQPSEVYDKSFTKKMMKALVNLSINLKSYPITETEFINIQWEFPYHKSYSEKFYNIIYLYAKLIHVKVMYKDILESSSLDTKKSLLIIGDTSRVHIMIHVMNHYFKGYFQYEQWIKHNCKKEAKWVGVKDIRIYSSKLLELQLDKLYNFAKSLLEIDEKYEHRLENYIMGQFNLDYKSYNTNAKAYYHAISTTYQHRRMLV